MKEGLLLVGVCLLLAVMTVARIKLIPERHPKTDLIIDLLNRLGARR
ncbi:hypothetical protein SAMN02745206_01078 [Desulfacinum infernum DSM 9756]|uniref:Uncharacterized protein n=1 Tax=Desulfacinum infernum DSM 9756 TaxID=1121391 RepID=A0A1M4XPN0_9BACT|nr:hypothetical protein [Desulfacinum infernum]SHE95326.1 hypothetical protein SAMN02745206_01078 [Desulfacinum infernum DSM 9756]